MDNQPWKEGTRDVEDYKEDISVGCERNCGNRRSGDRGRRGRDTMIQMKDRKAATSSQQLSIFDSYGKEGPTHFC